MAWRTEKTEEGQDLVWDGVEIGIAPSPFKGTANIQNANISTELGDVMASFSRTAQQQEAITNGTLTPDGATDFIGPANLKAGTWINVTASTVSSISTTTTSSTVTVSYLAAGGGGGGGGANSLGSNLDAYGGGGGAGEVEIGTTSVSATSYAVTIGIGGTAGDSSGSAGTNGTNTTIGSLVTALGGGGGGGSDNATDDGLSGGNGGGGGAESSAPSSGTGGTGTAGFAGGNGSSGSGGGGGGGAGAVGAPGAGDGGTGVASSISGVNTYYGGGGGGGAAGGVSPSPGDGGQGGGGEGGSRNGAGGPTVPATAGTANTGGGGGGGGGTDSTDSTGADGGSGIVIISYPTNSIIATGGTITTSGANTIHTFTSDGVFKVLFIPKQNQYYVSYKSGTTIRLSSKFDPTGANALTHGTTGTVTFSTVTVPNRMINKTVEKYTTATTVEYRYYLLDANGFVWVYDTLINGTYGTTWMLPDPNDYSSFYITGIGVINGMLVAVGKAFIFGKPTVNLGQIYKLFSNVYLNEPFPTHQSPVLVGSQGKLYYGDGNYIGEIFPTTSLITSVANIQSLCSYTASTTTGTISAVISGSLPYSPDTTRIPVVFFTDVYGTQPTDLVLGNIYYIQYDALSGTFDVYPTNVSTSKINMATGAVGNQYFTTFWPFENGSTTSATPMVQVTTQRVNLPAYEIVQSLVEIGNTVLIGGVTNNVYPWNQVDAIPSDVIALPENNVKAMINVNNMAYIFAGNKGNIYISNSALASLALKIPDYTAGVPGTKNSYVEPYFTWGDAMYCRGKVYCSILDQTATKAGNCGGVWSFVPSQNVDPSQEIGSALKLENQNSYGTYDGYATILLPAMEQDTKGAQYWSAWQSSYDTGVATYGIDFSNQTPVTTFAFETDILPTGTILSKNTFTQLEYKLSTPLESGESLQLYFRLNSTDAWTSAGTTILETSNPLAGYYQMAFQKTQWLQIRGVATTNGSTNSSFVRVQQIRLR